MMPEIPCRIVITGASGFIGARVAEMMVARGHKLALLLRNPELAWRIQALLSHVEVIHGNIGDADSYRQHLMQFRPDRIVHLAWHGVGGADRNVIAQATNISNSLELLKIGTEAGAQHFIGLGSQAEYGPLNCRLDETAATTPTTLYGHSKLATCNMARLLCSQTDVRFAWLRLFSSYGPRDNPDWLIPSMILKLSKGEKLSLTRGEQLWDFIHVDDAVAAIVAVAENITANGVFNLGSGTAPTLRETILLLRDLIDPAGQLGFGEIPYRPDQTMHLEADITRLSQKTGWKPKIDIKTGLQQTIDWFTKDSHAHLQ